MKKTIVAILILAVIGAVAVLLFWVVPYSEAVLVRVAQVQVSTLRNSIGTNGKIEADKTYEIRAPFAGTCRIIKAHAGDNLKLGQPILTVEDPALESELASARAELQAAEVDLQNIQRGPTKEELNQAEADIARLRLDLENSRKTLETNEWLAKKDAISRFDTQQSRNEVGRLQQQLDAAITRKQDLQSRHTEGDRKRAVARIEAARSKIQLLEGNMARSVVRAPLDGTLYHFDLKSGAYVNAGELIGLFADLSRLRVRAFVDEPELGQIPLGAEVVIRWDAHPQESWKGIVRSIPSEVVTHGTRSVAEVLCSIESPRTELIPNVNVDVEIMNADGTPVPVLPRNTVFFEGKDHYAWTIRNGQAARRSVSTGRGTPSLIEIKTGLVPGDQVIIPGEVPISEGMKVRVSEK